MQKNFPSIRTLMLQLDITRIAAANVRTVMQARKREDVWQLSAAAYNYERSCYNRPDFSILKLYAIDELIGTCGIEGFRTRKGALEYCNAGDTYAATVIYYQGRFSVGCWGDIFERDGDEGHNEY